MHESGNMVEYSAMSTSQGTYGQTKKKRCYRPIRAAGKFSLGPSFDVTIWFICEGEGLQPPAGNT